MVYAFLWLCYGVLLTYILYKERPLPKGTSEKYADL